MNRSWVRFPQAAQIRLPGSGWAFLYALLVACCLLRRHGCSGRRMARPPARLGDLTLFGAAPRSPPVPSGPSGALHTGSALVLCVARPGPAAALHTCGAFVADVAWCVCSLSGYGCQPAISHVIRLRLVQTLNSKRWNCNAFGVSRKMTAINYVRDLAGGEWRLLPRVPQSGPVGQAARWCETPVTFARLCLCGFETAITFARLCLCGFEVKSCGVV